MIKMSLSTFLDPRYKDKFFSGEQMAEVTVELKRST